jgi:hypothetical protein
LSNAIARRKSRGSSGQIIIGTDVLRTLRIVSAGLQAAVLVSASASDELPRFDQYPVHEKVSGPVAKPVLRSKQDRQFQHQLQRAAQMRPNFAGYYVLTIFGCGTSCVMGGALDARSGQVTWLPFTVCCGNYEGTEPVEFRPDSALLVVHGMRNESGDGTYYYLHAAGGFTLIAERPR